MSRSLLPRALAALLTVLLAATPAAGADPVPIHVPPTVAPVSDPFRPPVQPYGPGNRGIEYDTEPGSPVSASAAGEVVFAGEVAGTRHVTLLHADGVRTSYSFLQDVEVVLGQRLAQGDPLGAAGEILHFGARRGDAYFDPASLFGSAGVAEVELLPFEVPPGEGPQAELAALVQVTLDQGGLGAIGLDRSFGWLVGRAELLDHYLRTLDPRLRALDSVVDVASRVLQPGECSDAPAPSRPVTDSDRQALLVGGLGSSVESASINDLRVDDLGYVAAAVNRLAYDSEGDLHAAAQRLADEVEAAVAGGEAPLDLYGHSMGGVVVRLGLLELQRRRFDFGRLGLVATFGSPHQGADLATAAVSGGMWSDVPAVGQLAETSDVIRDLQEAGVPDGVNLLSLAASGDVVVAAPKTVVPGATNVTVGLTSDEAHGDLVGSDEATEEVARALAREPPGCESPGEVLDEHVTGATISYIEDLAGFAMVPAGG